MRMPTAPEQAYTVKAQRKYIDGLPAPPVPFSAAPAHGNILKRDKQQEEHSIGI